MKSTDDIVAELRVAFPQEDVKQRTDNSGTFDYIEQADVMNRLFDATGGVFDIRIDSAPSLVTYPKVKTGESQVCWMATVTLVIPGLGSRSNVGTSKVLNEDSPKAAVTDAIKKAATLFGVALHLYEKEGREIDSRGRGQGQGPGGILAGTKNDSGAQCSSCNCPNGAYHTKNCKARQAA